MLINKLTCGLTGLHTSTNTMLNSFVPLKTRHLYPPGSRFHWTGQPEAGGRSKARWRTKAGARSTAAIHADADALTVSVTDADTEAVSGADAAHQQTAAVSPQGADQNEINGYVVQSDGGNWSSGHLGLSYLISPALCLLISNISVSLLCKAESRNSLKSGAVKQNESSRERWGNGEQCCLNTGHLYWYKSGRSLCL